MLVFKERGDRSIRKKTSRCRVESQQTQPTYDAGSGNRTTFAQLATPPYVSKLSEKAAAIQLTDHMTANGLNMQFQSAYKQHHSTTEVVVAKSEK